MPPAYFTSPWSNTLKISTSVFLVVLLTAMFVSPPLGKVFCGVLIIASLLLMVNGYSIQEGKLYVHGLLWRKMFDLCELEDIVVEPFATARSIRTFGIGGLFSSMGYFSSQVLGAYLAFMTDVQNTVVVDFVGQRLVITPNDPQGFRDALLTEYRRIHL